MLRRAITRIASFTAGNRVLLLIQSDSVLSNIQAAASSPLLLRLWLLSAHRLGSALKTDGSFYCETDTRAVVRRVRAGFSQILGLSGAGRARHRRAAVADGARSKVEVAAGGRVAAGRRRKTSGPRCHLTTSRRTPALARACLPRDCPIVTDKCLP